MTQDDLRYPIGQFEHEGEVSAEELRLWTGQIEAFPEQLREVAEALSVEQLKTQYRPGGWTLCQVLHHLPDSHLNAYLRFKWALTEPFPTIKPYDEKASAELAVCRDPRVDSSLLLLDALHLKWVELIRSLFRDDVGKRFMHPELGPVELALSVGHCAWHGRPSLFASSTHKTPVRDRTPILGHTPRDQVTIRCRLFAKVRE